MLAGEPGSVTLKCDPDWAVELREIYAAVRPGYHTNKRHWNTVDLDGTVDDPELQEMIEHASELVVSRLPRPERDRLPDGDPPPTDVSMPRPLLRPAHALDETVLRGQHPAFEEQLEP